MTRYADEPGTSREVHIAASPSQVWEIITDVEAMTAWSPELVRVEWPDEASQANSPAPGARYIGHNEHPVNGTWRTIAHFTAVDPEHTLTWAILDTDGRYGKPAEDLADRMATWTFTVAPARDSGTVLRQSMTIGPGRSGLSAYIDRAPEQEEAIIAYRLRELGKGMEATLDGIKERTEGRDERRPKA